jgi:hypothetical protein
MGIKEFRGNYYFLSNFYNAKVTYQGVTYLNNEAAFQSMKCNDIHQRQQFSMHFTENTLVSGDIMPADIVDLNDYVVDEWPSTPEGLVRQAEEMTTHYKSLFEDPNVESITYWGFIDGGWLKAPSGFITEDNKIKPSYEALRKLVKDEWWTKPMELVTDENGMITVSGFLGEYEASFAGETLRFSVEKEGEPVNITF